MASDFGHGAHPSFSAPQLISCCCLRCHLCCRRNPFCPAAAAAAVQIDYVNEAHSQGKRILIEGANATMLDIDFGTYPFVTSSNPSIGGIVTGLGLAPAKFDAIVGVVSLFSCSLQFRCAGFLQPLFSRVLGVSVLGVSELSPPLSLQLSSECQ